MKNILLILSLAVFCTSQAQTGNLKGKVTDQRNQPLHNVNVALSNTSLGATTDEAGNYQINDLAPGSYSLTFSMVGYGTKNISVTVYADQTTNVPAIVLAEKQEQLNEVVVEGHQNKYVENKPSTSLRLKTELVKLPQNVQVISADLLKDQQATTIMDGVIRNVSGVTMLEHWGQFARIHMRGFRLPAFRNGVNVQDTWGPLAEDMNTVERIEFVKGPAGFMMSAGEPGGFYNVVTKKPTEQFIANASFSVGSFDFYRGTVDVSGKLSENGKLLGRFNAMYQTTDSHRGNEDVTRYGIAPSLTYKFSDKTSITTEMNLQQAESYLGSAYIFAPASAGYASLDRDFKFTNNDYPVTDIQEVTFFANMKHEFSDNWSMEGQLAYLRYDQVGNSTWLLSMADNGDAYRYVSKWDALSIGKFGQIYIYGAFNTGGVSHKVMGGFDYSDKTYWADWFESSVVDTDAPFNIYNPVYGESPETNFNRSVSVQYRNGGTPYGSNIARAYYAQDEIGFLENHIRLTLAGRYTNLYSLGKTETDDVFTPRVGLSVDIIPSLTAYALYDQSFLPQSGVNSSGDILNDPVEGKDIEGGIKANFFEGRLVTSLGVYKINKNKILVGDPAFPNDNFSIYSGEIESKGIEFDAQGQITPELNLVLNYANTNVEDQSGNLVAGFAKHVTNGWLNYNFAETSTLKGFGASLGYQYQVDRSTWAWAADNQSDLPNYFRLDGALSWRNDHFRVQVNINNILDEYLYSGANYGSYLYWQSEPGINGRLTVSYTF
ncbi:TonB-dependent siderophore receptor [Flagellimonas pelagia]|uniref:TonB-dependent receptor n=1 Tax=Flagellimonas pelagia TaxID=2306998 RepID=A0A3A1NPA6_9FLAO|nr:TonB-dependent siderophore receptor [Allomuricauda maritima]RIV46911.1 TonB-dependent siderophore receptor [Allomuricauda maritima]TXJ99800.1 TonB-dependent receptor [Allomuricauda maritima]